MQLTRSFWGEPEICHVVGSLCVTIMSNISSCVRVPLNGEGQQGQRVCGKSEENQSGQKDQELLPPGEIGPAGQSDLGKGIPET